MEKVIIYEQEAQYRDNFRIRGYRFGKGEKALAVVGSMRGNEHQQLFACSQLVKRLQEIEAAGQLCGDKEILVIPCANPYSMNIRKRFWTIDNTDINRMFPGYDKGETTQRIAAGIFNAVKDYTYGVQFASFYMRGSFAPHVRMMRTGFEDVESAFAFGLPYVIVRDPRPFDTTTLNYNWQIWETSAFSLYTTNTERINRQSAAEAVAAILHFMAQKDLITEEGAHTAAQGSQAAAQGSRAADQGSQAADQGSQAADQGSQAADQGSQSMDQEDRPAAASQARLVFDDDLVTVRALSAGFFQSCVRPGQSIRKGEELALIEDAYDGHLLARILSPVEGTILFMHDEEMCYADSAVFKIMAD